MPTPFFDRRDLTQDELAAALGRSRTAVSDRFRCKVAWSLDDVGRIAELFGCHVLDLVSEPRRPESYKW